MITRVVLANPPHLQLKQAASSRFSLAPSALKYIMRAPLTQADLHSEHPSLADVIANISSKTAAVQDEYLRGADMTFTTSSTLADLLELHMSGSAFFTAEQNTCLSENIARVKRAAGCEDGDAQLQAPVSPYKDLAAAAAVDVTHGNLKQYAAGVAETLCWTHSLAALNSMREGYAPPPHRLLRPSASSLPSPPLPSRLLLQVRALYAAHRAAPHARRRRARRLVRAGHRRVRMAAAHGAARCKCAGGGAEAAVWVVLELCRAVLAGG